MDQSLRTADFSYPSRWGQPSGLKPCLYLGVKEITLNEAGSMAQASPGPAYWFWLQAMVGINLWSWLRPSSQEQKDRPEGR